MLRSKLAQIRNHRDRDGAPASNLLSVCFGASYSFYSSWVRCRGFGAGKDLDSVCRQDPVRAWVVGVSLGTRRGALSRASEQLFLCDRELTLFEEHGGQEVDITFRSEYAGITGTPFSASSFERPPPEWGFP